MSSAAKAILESADIERRLRKIESGEATFVGAEEVFERSQAILRGER